MAIPRSVCVDVGQFTTNRGVQGCNEAVSSRSPNLTKHLAETVAALEASGKPNSQPEFKHRADVPRQLAPLLVVHRSALQIFQQCSTLPEILAFRFSLNLPRRDRAVATAILEAHRAAVCGVLRSSIPEQSEEESIV